MKNLTLFLLTTTLLLNADDVTLKTDLIDKKRQIHRELLSMELDMRDIKRLHILSQREHKPRLALEALRSKRMYLCN